jgi:hypothetical protein
MIVMACVVSARQRLVIATLDFTFLRILVLAGWLRLFVRGEAGSLRFNAIDKTLAGTVFFTALIGIIRVPTQAMLIFNLGTAFDAFGLYLFVRSVTRDWSDYRTIVSCFAIIGLITSAFFVYENLTRHNLFSTFGGVPEVTVIREGKLRCQGPFSHPILAGCFWASLLPLFAAEFRGSGPRRTIAALGTIGGVVIVFLSASSTPLAGVVAAIVGGALFRLRHRMQDVRRGLVALLAFLQLFMDRPIYHLISRIDLVGGSTGWHRYHLIDKAVRHFDEWALIGTNATGHWGHMTGDVANQYLVVGVRGGLISLVFFILMIRYAFGSVGRTWRQQRPNLLHVTRSWALGVSLFTHIMMFIAVQYFGQAIMIWYVLLGMIRSAEEFRVRKPSGTAEAIVEKGTPEPGPDTSLARGLRPGRAAMVARRWL